MARPPASPGPPPRHYRPPGAPASSTTPMPGLPLSTQQAPVPPPEEGLSAGAAVVIAVVTLLVGIVVGFFLGREFERDEASSAAPTSTTSTPAPPTTARPPGNTIPPDPPADPEAPPATDLEPTTLGTLDDPIPAGQSYVLGLYEVEVLEVDRDATGALQAYEPTNPPPPAGQQHVLVTVSVRFTDSSGVGNPAALGFFVSDGNQQWNDYEATCGFPPDALPTAGFIEQGEEAVGTTCFTVPSEVVDQLLLGTEGFDGPVYFELP